MTNDKSITIQLTITSAAGAPRTPMLLEDIDTITPTKLRTLIANKTNIPIEKLKVIFRGRLINNDDTKNVVEEYKLEKDSVLHLVGKPTQQQQPSSSTTTTTAASAAANTSSTATTTSGVAGSSVSILPGANTTTPTIPATTMPSSDPLLLAIQSMRTQNTNNTDVINTGLTTLSKILDNIIKNPHEDKYRQLKKNNPAFSKRLGGIKGGHELILSVGFTETTDVDKDGTTQVPVYKMVPNPSAWPKLLQDKATITNAIEQSRPNIGTAAAPTTFPGSSGSGGGMIPQGMMPVLGDAGNGMQLPPDMQAMMADPNFVTNMMQAMRNDPRFANNPMMQRAMEQMANDPTIASRMSEVIRNPQWMQQMQQAHQQMMGGNNNNAGGGGMGNMGMPDMGMGMGQIPNMQSPEFQQAMRNHPMFANNPQMQQAMQDMANDPAAAARLQAIMNNPQMMQQARQMMQQQHGIGGGGATAPNGGAVNNNNNNSGGGASGGGSNGQSDEQSTEEDMIAEAIRRSLQE